MSTQSMPIYLSATTCGDDHWHDDGSSTPLFVLSTSPMLFSLDSRIASGIVGSVVASFFSQPFEVAKVTQQNHRPMPGSESQGVVRTLRQLIAREGVRGAYAGLAPTVLMAMPNFGTFLVANDELVSFLKKNQSTVRLSDDAVPFVAGAIARWIATTVVAPLEMLRTRDASLANSHSTNNGTALSRVGYELHTILKRGGLGALYKGLFPSLLRDVPFAAVYMWCREKFRETSRPIVFIAQDHHHPHPMSLPQVLGFEFANAALAGMVAASCTAPLDVVKTRMQSMPRPGAQVLPLSTFTVLQSVVKQEGFSGLWRGNQARMMKVAPQYAIMISFYEVGQRMLA